MRYLLDANVLINAHDQYYPIHRIPQFWDWIIENAKSDRIKMPFEMLAEVKRGNQNRRKQLQEDELLRWLGRDNHEATLCLDASADRYIVNRVYREGYEIPQPSQDELNKIGKDPILIAYALAESDCKIVTMEAKQPNATDIMKKIKRKIPFVCRKLCIKCIDTFELIDELDFRIP